MDTKTFGRIIDERFPLNTQESWDNSGFQIVFPRDIRRILVALEITSSVIEEAVNRRADLIVTHHPLLFRGLKKIDMENIEGQYINELIANRISLYSSHTPFDIAAGGNNENIAKLLGLKDVSDFEVAWDPFLKKGRTERITVENFVEKVATDLNIDKSQIRVVGERGDLVETVAWCTGAGSDLIDNAIKEGVDLYMTGDVKYHNALKAKESGLIVIDLGHYGSEKNFIENMSSHIKDILENYNITDVDVIESTVDINPFLW